MQNGGPWAARVAAQLRHRLLSWLEHRFCQRFSQQVFQQLLQERERFFLHARLTGNVHRVQSLNDELALATQQRLATERHVTCSLVRMAKKWIGSLPVHPEARDLAETPAHHESLRRLSERLETLSISHPQSASSGETRPSLPRR
jgi:hypothetical protein